MPALPDPPSPVIKLNVHWGVEGDISAQTVHYVGFTGAASAGDLATMAIEVVFAGDAEFNALASNYDGMLACVARDITTDMGAEATAGTPWVGTRGTELLPPSAAALVNHSISRHYRGGRPRTYLPLGVSSDVATTGFWSTGFVDAVDSAWGVWVSAFTHTSFGSINVGSLLNVSYYKGFTPFTEPSGRVRNRPNLRAVPVLDDITGHTTSRVIGSQRRRNRDA
jgi:hypothetical protein